MPALIKSLKPITSLLIGLLTFAIPAFSQTTSRSQDPGEVVRVYTDLVQTDVMVFDKQGRFANGLRKKDFELRIDGKIRPIEFFERVTVGTANEETQLLAARGTSGLSKAGTPAVPLDRGRTIFFYIDDLHLGVSSMAATRKLIAGFIDAEMNQNDEVGITSASGQIGFLQQLTDNKTVLRAALQRLSTRSYSVRDFDRPAMSEYQALLIDRYDRGVFEFFVEETMRQNQFMGRQTAEGIVRARATSLLQQAANFTRSTLAGLESLVKSSRNLPGRKLVFFLSDGFFLDNRNSDSQERLRKITSDAARSGVVIYSLDARGLVASLDDLSVEAPFDPTGRLASATLGELPASQDAMNALARDTGGRPFFNSNALNIGVTKALEETSVYYLLAWKPEPGTSDTRKFRRIEVKLIDRPELSVRVRRGFFDVEPTADGTSAKSNKPATKTPEVQVREALGTPFPERTLPIALTLNYVSEPNNRLLLSSSMQIPNEFMSFSSVDGKRAAVVHVAGTVFNDQGRAGARFGERITFTSPAGISSSPSGDSLIYSFPVFLGPGLYQVRVAARDEKSGRTGSAHGWVEIPDLSNRKLALSSLIIGSTNRGSVMNKSSDSSPVVDDFSLSVDHQFQHNSHIRFLIFAYNSRSSVSTVPDLAAQVQVLRDNQPVVTTALKKIPTEGVDLDRVPYAADLSLAGLSSGRYLLQVTVIDRASKTSTSQQVRFGIE